MKAIKWSTTTPDYAMTYAVNRARLSRYKLPPGDWLPLDQAERNNQKILLQQAERYGPIFKVQDWRQPCICVIGITLGRRLLSDHGKSLKPHSIALQSLFPKGFMRQMEGKVHQQYRHTLSRTLKQWRYQDSAKQWQDISTKALSAFADYENQAQIQAEYYLKTLNRIATGMLLQLFYGVEPDTTEFQTLMGLYNQLGPHGVVWKIGERQQKTFLAIRTYLLKISKQQPENSGLLGKLAEQDLLDDTLLGNLIYMVELGRFDVYSLFRWISYYAGMQSDYLNRIAMQANDESIELADAFVMESLRMNQSERLIRVVQRDILFEGFLIPKFSMLRLCLWEAHKSEDYFDDPFQFKAERFLLNSYNNDCFAPFGLDHHRCLFADVVTAMSRCFLQVMAQNYTLQVTGEGDIIRGAYHWEPALNFSLDLSHRSR